MAAGYIEYNIVTPYTLTQNNTIGPTADTGERASGDLPHPGAATSSTDANTIYVDPVNGSDANSGQTLAAAKASLAGVIPSSAGIVTATRPNVHLQVSGGSGEYAMSETVTGFTDLDIDLLTIQAHPGQTFTVTFTGTGGYILLNNLTINGVKFVSNNEIFAMSSSDLTLEWAWLESADRVVSSSNAARTLTATDSALVRTEYVGGSGEAVAALGCRNLTLTRTICVAPNDLQQIFILGSAEPTNPVVLDIDFATFIGGAKALSLQNTAGTITTTSFDSSIFHRIGTLVAYDGSSGSSSTTTITRSLINTQSNGVAITSTGANVFNRDPLFLDEALLDFRLAHRGRSVNGVPYPMNSPAVGIGLSSADAGAYDMTYSAGNPTSDTFTFPGDLGPDAVKYRRRRSNFQKFESIRGYNFATWDETRHEVEISLPSKYWTGSDFAYDFLDLINSDGLKRFHPQGVDGLFDGAVTFTYVSDTEIQLTTLARNLRVNQLKGWVMKLDFRNAIDTEDEQGFYRVVSNTATNLTVEYIRGDPFTMSSQAPRTCIALYLPVILDMPDGELVSEYYAEDETNDVFKPWYKDDSDENPAEFHTRTLKLCETYERGDE